MKNKVLKQARVVCDIKNCCIPTVKFSIYYGPYSIFKGVQVCILLEYLNGVVYINVCCFNYACLSIIRTHPGPNEFG